MDRETMYSVWRGAGHPWVNWMKPPLFARIQGDALGPIPENAPGTPPWAVVDTSWLAPGMAVFVDLPGDQAVYVAVALGHRGMRPVLSINASSEPGELIPMDATLAAISFAARVPSAFPTGPQLPPAFVLDARRPGIHGTQLPVGALDNRWEILANDVPTGAELARFGIGAVVAVIPSSQGGALQKDLEHVFRGYSEAGLRLFVHDVGRPGLAPLTVAAPGLFERMAGAFRPSLNRNADGSYGSRVPPEHRHG